MDEGDEETGGGGGGEEWQMRFVVLQVQVVLTLLIFSLLSHQLSDADRGSTG